MSLQYTSLIIIYNLMKIVFFEINHLHSFRYREMITIEKIYRKSSFKGLSEPQYSTVMTNVFKREFSICDKAGGQIGKPPGFTKGNSHL